LAEIAADVRAGGRRDAILYAVGANAAHGLKRTNRGKRNAVMVLLKDPEWSDWADGPRFDEPVTDCFAPEIADDIVVNLKTAKALMLTVGRDGGCRSAAGGRLPVCGALQEWPGCI
jgi:hypothetical protein